MAKLFSSVHIADVHLNSGCGNCPQSVGNGEAIVAVGTGINDNAISVKSYPLNFIDDTSLAIALKK